MEKEILKRAYELLNKLEKQEIKLKEKYRKLEQAKKELSKIQVELKCLYNKFKQRIDNQMEGEELS